jgi:hypothetical protein
MIEPSGHRAARSAASGTVIGTTLRGVTWTVRYSAILLAGAMALAACEPYAVEGPSVYGSAQYGEVRDVQGGPRQLGYYDGPIDGIYGPETRQAIQRYQGDRGMLADGVIGRQLISRINSDVAAGTYPSDDGSAERRVSRVQAALSQLGYYDGRINGQPDRNTRQAIVTYRRERGLPVTDAIDRQLIESLQRDLAARPSPTPYPVSSRFEPGYDLPGGVRAMLDRRWQSYEGMLVDLDRDGDLDVIARAGQRSDDCRGGDCGYVVLENRRGDYTEIGAFAAGYVEVQRRGSTST